jgi:uncharacterized protein (TIGR00266 family)
MNLTLKGQPSFGYAVVDLDPGEYIMTESGAMATMSTDIDLKSELNGGLIIGLLKKFLGGETLFINKFTNIDGERRQMTLTQPTPGTMVVKELNNESIYLQPTAFIACEKGVNFGIKFASITSFISGEGLFKIQMSGTGKLLFGAYGQIIEKQVNGEMIVDTGHLVAYETQMKLNLQMSGGLVSSITSGEGLVTRVEGIGKIWIQTRNLKGLASWINRFF